MLPHLLRQCLIVGTGGFLGAIVRFLISTWAKGRYDHLPWATFGINVSGSFLLGLLMTLFLAKIVSDPWRLLLGVGFLGAYTTFSTFEYETARSPSLALGLANVLGSIVAGYLAVRLGMRLGQFWPVPHV